MFEFLLAFIVCISIINAIILTANIIAKFE